MIYKTFWSQKKGFKFLGHLSSFRGTALYEKVTQNLSSALPPFHLDNIQKKSNFFVKTSLILVNRTQPLGPLCLWQCFL